jgi:hypothetical protein
MQRIEDFHSFPFLAGVAEAGRLWREPRSTLAILLPTLSDSLGQAGRCGAVLFRSGSETNKRAAGLPSIWARGRILGTLSYAVNNMNQKKHSEKI